MGPLQGIRIIEISGVGPAPYAAMLLADNGAEVIRVEKIGGNPMAPAGKLDLMNRNKQCICVDIKSEAGTEIVKKLIADADGLLEGMRPGVMEKLGLGPDVLKKINPKLVYGRTTGWGQDGPLAQEAGHEINYIALSGVLHAVGRAGEKPTPPLPLTADFGGGGLFMAFGMTSALLEASKSGKGQVIDTAIVDGTAHMMSSLFGAQQFGFWSDERGTNLLDSGAHFYETYTCKDGKYIAIGALEGKFYQALLEGLGLADETLPDQMDMSQWPAMKEKFQQIIFGKTRDEWSAVFEGKNACVTPVLSTDEARQHPHNIARGTFTEDGDVWQPRTAPRFSRSDNSAIYNPSVLAENTDTVMQKLGYSKDEVKKLKSENIIG